MPHINHGSRWRLRLKIEPPHVISNNVAFWQVYTQTGLWSLPFKLRNSKWCSVSSLTLIEYSSHQQRLWSDCTNAQADLRHCWSHIPHYWKSHVVAQIMSGALPSNCVCMIKEWMYAYRKTCVKRPLSKRPKIGFHDQLSLNAGQKCCRMLQGENSAIPSTFIKLPFVI